MSTMWRSACGSSCSPVGATHTHTHTHVNMHISLQVLSIEECMRMRQCVSVCAPDKTSHEMGFDTCAREHTHTHTQCCMSRHRPRFLATTNTHLMLRVCTCKDRFLFWKQISQDQPRTSAPPRLNRLRKPRNRQCPSE